MLCARGTASERVSQRTNHQRGVQLRRGCPAPSACALAERACRREGIHRHQHVLSFVLIGALLRCCSSHCVVLLTVVLTVLFFSLCNPHRVKSGRHTSRQAHAGHALHRASIDNVKAAFAAVVTIPEQQDNAPGDVCNGDFTPRFRNAQRNARDLTTVTINNNGLLNHAHTRTRTHTHTHTHTRTHAHTEHARERQQPSVVFRAAPAPREHVLPAHDWGPGGVRAEAVNLPCFVQQVKLDHLGDGICMSCFKQTATCGYRRADTHAGTQAGRQTGRQTGRQAGTSRHIRWWLVRQKQQTVNQAHVTIPPSVDALNTLEPLTHPVNVEPGNEVRRVSVPTRTADTLWCHLREIAVQRCNVPFFHTLSGAHVQAPQVHAAGLPGRGIISMCMIKRKCAPRKKFAASNCVHVISKRQARKTHKRANTEQTRQLQKCTIAGKH